MKRWVLSVLLATTITPTLAGCGTCFNWLGAEKAGPRPDQDFGKIYGGLRFEADGMQSQVANYRNLESPGAMRTIQALSAVGLLALDMPFTAIGDTLMLPYTISYTRQCRTLVEEKAAKPEPPPSPVTVE